MKNVIFLFMIIMLYPIWAQDGPGRKHNHFSKRFEELEKIKLLEILDMDEETAIKFFVRRNQTRKNIEELMKNGEKTYQKMEKVLNEVGNESKYSMLIEKAQNIDKEIMREKSRFINSLNDILTKKQILKLVLFERNFRKDVRDLLIEKGRRKFKKEKNYN